MSETTMERTARTETSTRRRVSALAYYVYCEVLKLLRIPMFVIPIFVFPILFFAMFALPYVDQKLGGVNAGQYVMASYGTYAVMSVALFSFGASIAAERGMKWNLLLRATPLSPLTYFLAKISMALILGVAVLAAYFTFGAVIGGVSMGFWTWAELTGLLVFGMTPFVALGLFIGYATGPNSSAAVANLVLFPLAFASGLFLPIQQLPEVIQNIAPYLPSYHAAQLGWSTLGVDDGKPLWVHLLWIAGYTLVFLVIAVIAYHRDEGKTFG